MTRTFACSALVALSFAAVSPAVAGDNYIIGSGISRSEAQTLTLDEVAVALFNQGTSGDDRQIVVTSSGSVTVDPVRHAQLIAAAGLSPEMAQGLTLGELAATKFNADAAGADQQTVQAPAGGPGRANAQLVAAAGLTPAEAQGMSLGEIAAAKFARDSISDH